MNIPDFEEFLSSIPPEQLEYIKTGITSEILKSSKDINELIGMSCVASIKASFALLSLYHQWIRDYLG